MSQDEGCLNQLGHPHSTQNTHTSRSWAVLTALKKVQNSRGGLVTNTMEMKTVDLVPALRTKNYLSIPQTARERGLLKGRALPRTRLGLFHLPGACWLRVPTTGNTLIWPAGPRTQSRHGKHKNVRLELLTYFCLFHSSYQEEVTSARTNFLLLSPFTERTRTQTGLQLFKSFSKRKTTTRGCCYGNAF